MTDYKPQQLDKKWQQHWTADARVRSARSIRARPKFYCLEMFAYPSGHAHVGHVRNYIIGDVMARMKRMRGFNVLHPFGWDAFGLPAENAAIKTGTHPETSTLDNIAHMKGQLQRLGISYAWEREIATCLPEYYKFNQWIFLKMFERGLAYRKRSTVNWCPSRQHGARQRAGRSTAPAGAAARPSSTRDLEQWFFRITAYADELLDGPRHADRVAGKGRRDAAELDRPLRRRARQVPGRRRRRRRASRSSRRASTRSTARRSSCSRPSIRWSTASRRESADPAAFREQVAAFRALDREARLTGAIEKEGFDTGRTAINPFTGEQVPIWVANFVLAEYGTGAIMAVPGARRARLRVRAQVQPADPHRRPGRRRRRRRPTTMTEATTNYGRLVELGRVRRAAEAPAVIDADDRRRREARHRQGRGAVPPEGLGHLAPALLGHADSGRLLREGRRRAGAVRAAAGRAAEGDARSPAAAIRRWRRCRSSST